MKKLNSSSHDPEPSHRRIAALVAVTIACLILSAGSAEAKQISGTALIDSGNFRGWRMDVAIPSTIEFNFTSTNLTPVDIMVVDQDNFTRFSQNLSFQYYAEYSFFNVTTASANLTVLSGTVYVVVDNSGMPRASSCANSSEQAKIEYWIGTSFSFDSAPDFGTSGLMTAFALLLSAVLVTFIIFFRKAIREGRGDKQQKE